MTGAGSELPYGSWPSPITAAAVAASANSPGEIRADGADIWWSESRASEGGRIQLVRVAPDGELRDVLPDGYSVRTRVHEYGGGAWAVRGGTVVFANWDDQRLYRLDGAGTAGGTGAESVPLTPEPDVRHGLRYAEVSITPDERWAVCVRESHEPGAIAEHGEAVNEIVAVPIDGSAATDPHALRILLSGADFYAGPTVSPDGRWLAFVQWAHPNMPWDDTRLHVVPFHPGKGGWRIHTLAAGLGRSRGDAVVQPCWGSDGRLWWAADGVAAASPHSGWWNLRRSAITVAARPGGHGPVRTPVGDDVPLLRERDAFAPVKAEIGGPHWVFGQRWFALMGDGSVVASVASEGLDRLMIVTADGELHDLGLPFTSISQVVAGTCDDEVLVVAATPTDDLAPWRVQLDREGAAATVASADPGDRPPSRQPDVDRATGSATATPLRAPWADAAGEPWDRAAWTSVPEPLDFASAGGRTAHALLYRPRNPNVTAPAEEKPPLLVLSHGGPTSAARAMYKAATQFWTSRGFAVVDVNYGGSTGYGRPYRELLQGKWGIVDREDCEAAARHLVDEGIVDPAKLAIRGGSAGGYTTLCALTFGDTFAAGASHYGVADLAALATDTHKFESRYLDGLVGPWPEAEAVYRERSPIHHTDRLSCPLILFQGLEDEVVPAAQAEQMVTALAAKGVAHAYVPFEGEQHGFRRAENIIRALEAELWFYGKVFGFTPADAIEPVEGAVGLP